MPEPEGLGHFHMFTANAGQLDRSTSRTSELSSNETPAVGSHSVGARGKPRAVHARRGDTNRRARFRGASRPAYYRATTPFGGRLIWREYRHRRGSLNL